MNEGTHILFGVLSWGLGHASRCIPLINTYLTKGFKLTIASDGLALKLLKNEFPTAQFLELPDPKIAYSANREQSFALAKQLFSLQGWYRKEQKIVAKFLLENKIDKIISDNRPTVKSSKIPSYYITHQLEVKSGIFTPFSTLGHELLFKNYTEIWVPDVPGTPNLSGDLSHKSTLKNITFIGPLSDLKPKKCLPEFDAALILSGPEPQRTLFENATIAQLGNSDLRILLLRGSTIAPERVIPKHWQSLDLANRGAVQKAFEKSRVIIARSGYTTLMDLYSFTKPAILVPTPGQPEQEYLATLPLHRHNFVVQQQNNLNLILGLHEAEKKFDAFTNPL